MLQTHEVIPDPTSKLFYYLVK